MFCSYFLPSSYIYCHRLGQKLFDLRLKVVQTFRNFEFEAFTPIVQEQFPDLGLDLPNPGINELFKPPKRGRPP